MTDTAGTRAFAALAEKLLAAHPEDEEGRMLHAPGLKTGGKFYAFAPGDDLVVKLPAGRVGELVGGGLGLPCAPRAGRPMREWVRIPAEDAARWPAYVAEARAFVRNRPE